MIRRKSSRSVASVRVSERRPPPARRTITSANPDASRSFKPRPIVLRAIPVAGQDRSQRIADCESPRGSCQSERKRRRPLPRPSGRPLQGNGHLVELRLSILEGKLPLFRRHAAEVVRKEAYRAAILAESVHVVVPEGENLIDRHRPLAAPRARKQSVWSSTPSRSASPAQALGGACWPTRSSG